MTSSINSKTDPGSFGGFNELRNSGRKEARAVRSWESEDCEGSEKAMGEGPSTS
jgi:hypothetical protein